MHGHFRAGGQFAASQHHAPLDIALPIQLKPFQAREQRLHEGKRGKARVQVDLAIEPRQLRLPRRQWQGTGVQMQIGTRAFDEIGDRRQFQMQGDAIPNGTHRQPRIVLHMMPGMGGGLDGNAHTQIRVGTDPATIQHDATGHVAAPRMQGVGHVEGFVHIDGKPRPMTRKRGIHMQKIEQSDASMLTASMRMDFGIALQMQVACQHHIATTHDTLFQLQRGGPKLEQTATQLLRPARLCASLAFQQQFIEREAQRRGHTDIFEHQSQAVSGRRWRWQIVFDAAHRDVRAIASNPDESQLLAHQRPQRDATGRPLCMDLPGVVPHLALHRHIPQRDATGPEHQAASPVHREAFRLAVDQRLQQRGVDQRVDHDQIDHHHDERDAHQAHCAGSFRNGRIGQCHWVAIIPA